MRELGKRFDNLFSVSIAIALQTADAVQELLVDMGISPSSYPQGLPHRAVYCNRTLNLRSIQACFTLRWRHMLICSLPDDLQHCHARVLCPTPLSKPWRLLAT